LNAQKIFDSQIFILGASDYYIKRQAQASEDGGKWEEAAREWKILVGMKAELAREREGSEAATGTGGCGRVWQWSDNDHLKPNSHDSYQPLFNKKSPHHRVVV